MKTYRLLCALIGISLLAWACGVIPSTPTVVPAADSQTAQALAPSAEPSATPDLCSQANLGESVKIVNTYMYQFHNYATLSATVGPTPAAVMLSSMQAIRTAAQQKAVPACLTDLKHYAILYMDAVIQTEMGFQTHLDANALSTGILQARQYNDQYAAELARLLGVTLAPNATAAAQGGTPGGETSTPAIPMVLNPGPNPLNLHVSPSLTAQAVGVLNASETAKATGRSLDGEWVQIEVPGEPGKLAWVYASLVQIVSGDANALPVANP